ncbi:MAG: glutaminyl-peptide cyclotransferase [Dehalococcoidales bacterium]|nr:glutaminyl-peptide cyclotransferase [Dehalococcoidales bacterium]
MKTSRGLRFVITLFHRGANPLLLVAIIFVLLSTSACLYRSGPTRRKPVPSPVTTAPAPVYTYRVVNAYPHDPQAFTQGLAFDNGILYEGTGLYGSSSLRRVDRETGEVLQIHNLPAEYFGEGITVYQGTIIQLTWQSYTGFIYDRDSFDLLRQFSYPTEGWGVTHDGERIIMSDGTSILHFLDPVTFSETGSVEVHDNDMPVTRINELEHINGEIYANVWQTDEIAIIDPRDGRVTGWIDLSGLLPTREVSGQVDVLNGIAYDSPAGRLFVTGKLWPWLFEIELVARQ